MPAETLNKCIQDVTQQASSPALHESKELDPTTDSRILIIENCDQAADAIHLRPVAVMSC